MVSTLLRLVTSTRFLISIVTLMVLTVSITTYLFFLNNFANIDNVAQENINVNTEIQAKQISETLSNEIEIVSSNLQIISNAPSVQGDRLTALPLFESAQESTKHLTDFYSWANNSGNIKWRSDFKDKERYDNLLDKSIASKEHFMKVHSTLKPYVTPLEYSVLNIPTIFVSYPVLIPRDNSNEDLGQKYTTKNLFEIVDEQQKKRENTQYDFEGTVYAGINLTQMIKLLENQVSLKNRSAISLFDRDGMLIYSGNKELDNILFNGQNNKDFIEKQYDEQNQLLVKKIKDKVLSGDNETLQIEDKNNNEFTISYSPVRVNNEDVLYLLLSVPHTFTLEVNNLVHEQQKYTITSLLLTGGTVAILILLQVLFANTLRKEVASKTAELKDNVLLLEESNEQLKRHDKTLRDFINIAAHELRTPTQSITGYIEMLDNFPENFKKYLEPLRRNSERLCTLTEDILDVTRIESGILKLDKIKFDMTEKINHVIKDISIDKHLVVNKKTNIIFLPPKESITVFADKTRIYQVVNNLIKNAIKFTKEGNIIITLEKDYITKDGANKEYAVIKIKDTGEGIHSDILPRLFEKFATKSVSGTGLGLYISKNIIDAHGGKIWGINNQDGKGAEFGFTLPIE